MASVSSDAVGAYVHMHVLYHMVRYSTRVSGDKLGLNVHEAKAYVLDQCIVGDACTHRQTAGSSRSRDTQQTHHRDL